MAAKIIANFGDFFLPQKSLKMRDVLEKMRECGKLQNLRDFPHDCVMVDTYDIILGDMFDMKGHCIEFKYYADGIHSGLTLPAG